MAADKHTIDIRMKMKTGIRANLAFWLVCHTPYKPLQHWLLRRLFDTIADYEIVKG